MAADQLLNQQLSCLCPQSLSCLVLSYQLVGGAGLVRWAAAAGSDNDSSKLLVVVEGGGSQQSHVAGPRASSQLCGQHRAGWCRADSLALVPHWQWSQHTGHTGCSQLTATSQHLQPHTGEAEAGLHLASTGDTGDTGVRRRERCPGGRPGTAGAGLL